jgi:alpha-glucosidase (family GH31 glycosyl hydrolase)
MITPIVTKGKPKRRVYLPADMIMVRYDGKDFSCTPAGKGELEIEVQLHEVVFFVLDGKLLPVGPAVTNSKDVTAEDLRLLGNGTAYEFYWDDGLTRDCTQNNIRLLRK